MTTKKKSASAKRPANKRVIRRHTVTSTHSQDPKEKEQPKQKEVEVEEQEQDGKEEVVPDDPTDLASEPQLVNGKQVIFPNSVLPTF